jgi:hypothetical protein
MEIDFRAGPRAGFFIILPDQDHREPALVDELAAPKLCLPMSSAQRLLDAGGKPRDRPTSTRRNDNLRALGLRG